MKTIAVAAVAALLCLAPLAAADDAAPAEKTGLKVGENAPAFKLRDQTGNLVILNPHTTGGIS
jgi:hypothetical protein